MKRKIFIASAAVITVGLPVVYYLKKYKRKNNNPLFTPDLLSNFCDEKAIRQIGLEYRMQAPLEDGKQKLTDLLLTDNNEKKMNISDKILISKLIDYKIHEDFFRFNITIINGWVISLTEARQCALFSLT